MNPAENNSNGNTTHRRGFLGTSLVGTAAATMMVHSSVEAQEEKRLIRIGVVGCGGRGSGAIGDSLKINENVKWIAAADVDTQSPKSKAEALKRQFPDKIDLQENKIYGGLDGYKRILDDKEIDLVIMTTPPGFRPRYVLEAVEAGKHVFAEKPTCVDPTGYRICLKAHELAVQKGTAIVTGTQYRRQTNYVGAVEQIRNGAIGDIVSATSRYCSTGIWYRARQKEMSDVHYQIHNWMHFIWLSGDQIAEQAVHNIDAMNWVMGGNPETAYGGGGRFTRPDDSEMWDSMCIDYVYPGNKLLSFMCRQLPDSDSDNGSVIHGTEGTCYIPAMSGTSKIVNRAGETIWSLKGSIDDAYRQEHKDLVDSIRAGKPIVELKQTADSSLTAVMGRLAAYTGKKVTWDFVTNESKLDLWPGDFKWDGSLPAPQFAKPGTTKLT